MVPGSKRPSSPVLPTIPCCASLLLFQGSHAVLQSFSWLAVPPQGLSLTSSPRQCLPFPHLWLGSVRTAPRLHLTSFLPTCLPLLGCNLGDEDLALPSLHPQHLESTLHSTDAVIGQCPAHSLCSPILEGSLLTILKQVPRCSFSPLPAGLRLGRASTLSLSVSYRALHTPFQMVRRD